MQLRSLSLPTIKATLIKTTHMPAVYRDGVHADVSEKYHPPNSIWACLCRSKHWKKEAPWSESSLQLVEGSCHKEGRSGITRKLGFSRACQKGSPLPLANRGSESGQPGGRCLGQKWRGRKRMAVIFALVLEGRFTKEQAVGALVPWESLFP